MGKNAASQEEETGKDEENDFVVIEPTSSRKEKKTTRFHGSKSRKKHSEKEDNEKESKNETRASRSASSHSKSQPAIHFSLEDSEVTENGDHPDSEDAIKNVEKNSYVLGTSAMSFDIVPGRNLKNNLKRSSESKRLQQNITSKLQKFIHLTNSCEDESVLLELEKETDILLNNIQQHTKEVDTAESPSSSPQPPPEVDRESRPSTGASRPCTSGSSTGEPSVLSGRKSQINRDGAERTRQCPKLFSTSTLPEHSKRIHCDLMSQWYRANTTIGKLIADNRQQSANAPFIVDIDYNEGTIENEKVEPSSKSDDVEILCVRTRHRSRPKQRISATFNKEIDQQLSTDCRLTDETINLAQKILFEQFPRFVGFEDTNLGVSNGFSKHSEPFVQILYADAHWITTSSLNNARINVYDSNFTGKLSRSFEKQICQLMRCPLNSLEIMLNSVQTQSNDIDCGLFAVAFAVDICFGTSPINRPYDVHAMRDHLRSCLIAGKFSLFPTYSGRIRFCKSRLLVQDVFCICRQSFYSAECEGDSKLFMAKCSSCMEWYHRGCVNIPVKVFKEEKEHERWTCPG